LGGEVAGHTFLFAKIFICMFNNRNLRLFVDTFFIPNFSIKSCYMAKKILVFKDIEEILFILELWYY